MTDAATEAAAVRCERRGIQYALLNPSGAMRILDLPQDDLTPWRQR